MKVLIATQIFPNHARPEMAPYNRHQFAALAKYCDVDMRALIPVHPATRVLEWLVDKGARHLDDLLGPRAEPADPLTRIDVGASQLRQHADDLEPDVVDLQLAAQRRLVAEQVPRAVGADDGDRSGWIARGRVERNWPR